MFSSVPFVLMFSMWIFSRVSVVSYSAHSRTKVQRNFVVSNLSNDSPELVIVVVVVIFLLCLTFRIWTTISVRDFVSHKKVDVEECVIVFQSMLAHDINIPSNVFHFDCDRTV